MLVILVLWKADFPIVVTVFGNITFPVFLLKHSITFVLFLLYIMLSLIVKYGWFDGMFTVMFDSPMNGAPSISFTLVGIFICLNLSQL